MTSGLRGGRPKWRTDDEDDATDADAAHDEVRQARRAIVDVVVGSLIAGACVVAWALGGSGDV